MVVIVYNDLKYLRIHYAFQVTTKTVTTVGLLHQSTELITNLYFHGPYFEIGMILFV